MANLRPEDERMELPTVWGEAARTEVQSSANERDPSTLAVGTGQRFPRVIGLGDHIGRFVVREILGRGGMGLVVSADDPQLERRVAIKLIDASESGTPGASGARLLREARAMARLRHPNIVSVFEAGEHQGQVYVAMEQVDGGSLRDEVGRIRYAAGGDWRQIVALFAKAGRGLAAAHAAGMVHRDFKSENVLIDTEGDRVLVGDFGIVGSVGSRGPRCDHDAELFSEQLTDANEVMGTPIYMAPEQHEGDAVDARADQFSFCVALYEALYRQLPFAGSTRLSYLESVRKGEVRSAPPGCRVPAWLHAVLLRGLSPDRAARFASMDDLLLELGAYPETTPRLGATERMAFVGGLVAFVIAWSGAVVGLNVELTYGLHYTTDFGFLALFALLGWFARDAIRRSEFNRRAAAFFATTTISLVVLVIGADLMNVSAGTVGALHMFVMGVITMFSFSLFGTRVLPGAAFYFIGFLLASAEPDLLMHILGATHLVGAVTAFSVFRAQPRLQRS
jgi:hypothetical protein